MLTHHELSRLLLDEAAREAGLRLREVASPHSHEVGFAVYGRLNADLHYVIHGHGFLDVRDTTVSFYVHGMQAEAWELADPHLVTKLSWALNDAFVACQHPNPGLHA